MERFEALIDSWDGDWVLTARDVAADAWIFLSIHDTTLGMALGGCRFKVYPTPADGLEDGMRLARGMTYKWAAIDFPFGGGKTVIACTAPPTEAERERLLLRVGDIIASLGGSYGTGCDMGTTPDDMVIIGQRTRWVFGRPEGQGGQGDPGPWTARGVEAGMRAACRHAFDGVGIQGRTVLIQGAGGVGRPLAKRLAQAGARLLISDAFPERAKSLAAEVEAETIPPEDVYDVECDVFSPCAIGGILNERSIGRLRCRVVAGSANNQLRQDEDAERLLERGIIYAPDFVINAGGAIAHGALELLGWTEPDTAVRIDAIETTIDEILEEAETRNESPLRGAARRAERILAEARARRAAGGPARD